MFTISKNTGVQIHVPVDLINISDDISDLCNGNKIRIIRTGKHIAVYLEDGKNCYKKTEEERWWNQWNYDNTLHTYKSRIVTEFVDTLRLVI